MALRMSEADGDVLLRGRIIESSRLWRAGRTTEGICGSGGRAASMRVVVGRDSGLSIEERTWLSWWDRVWVEAAVDITVEDAMLL